MIDRRSVFFLVAAAACFALVPVAFPEHRWVAIALGATYVVYAVLSALDAASRRRR